MSNKKHYVYVHRYATGPKAGQVFYVGKGCGFRAFERSKHRRNIYWIRVVNKYGHKVDVVKKFSTQECALTFEKILISNYGRAALVNLTDGGEGFLGANHKEKSIKMMMNNSNSKIVNCSNGMSFPSMSEACRWLVSNGLEAATPSMISQCCSGKVNTAYGFSWWLHNSEEVLYLPHYDRISISKSKPVKRSDGVIFYGISEAARCMSQDLGINVSAGNISMVCRGVRKTAYGYKWFYAS